VFNDEAKKSHDQRKKSDPDLKMNPRPEPQSSTSWSRTKGDAKCQLESAQSPSPKGKEGSSLCYQKPRACSLTQGKTAKKNNLTKSKKGSIEIIVAKIRSKLAKKGTEKKKRGRLQQHQMRKRWDESSGNSLS